MSESDDDAPLITRLPTRQRDSGQMQSIKASTAAAKKRSPPSRKRKTAKVVKRKRGRVDPMDADYDDSDDKDFQARCNSSDSDGMPVCGPAKRNAVQAGGHRRGQVARGACAGGAVGHGGLLYKIPEDILVKRIIIGQRLSQAVKCRLYVSCKALKRQLETPEDIVRLKRMRGVRSADLSGLNLGSHNQPPALLTALLQNCPLLDTLNLHNCYCTSPTFGITQTSMALVEQTLVDLRPTLANLCIEASPAGLRKIVGGLTNLESLHLTAHQHRAAMTGVKVSAIALPRLHTLSLCGVPGVTAGGIGAMLLACIGLRHLCLSELEKANDALFADVSPSLSNITQLTLHALPLTARGLRPVAAHCLKLQHLRLVHCNRIAVDGRGEVPGLGNMLCPKARAEGGSVGVAGGAGGGDEEGSGEQGGSELWFLARRGVLAHISLLVRPGALAPHELEHLMRVTLDVDIFWRSLVSIVGERKAPRVCVVEAEEPLPQLLATLHIAPTLTCLLDASAV